MLDALALVGALLAASPAAPVDIDPDGRIAEAVPRIVEAAMASRVGYDTLAELCDDYGHRLSGSASLEAAIDWSVAKMEELGFVEVRKEPVEVPVWVRNEESAAIVAPRHHELAMLGLGRSVGTGPDGLEAPVVRAASFEEFEALPDEAIAGHIVLWDAPWEGYGETVRYRSRGASVAAQRGAVAALVRSVGVDGLLTPHTGALRYEEDVAQIPAAAIAFEDANLIARLLARGKEVRVRLHMGAETLDDAVSHNVMGEIPGREKPEEVVVIGGHIDSWDVGQGAQDDGVGCILALEAARILKELGLQPRRTVRVVFWTNEENGLRGGTAYAESRAGEVDRHFAAIESDSGNGLADGFRFDLRAAALGTEPADAELDAARDRGLAALEPVARWLEPLGAGRIFTSSSGADIGPLAAAGVPCFGVNHDTSEYFRIHHTGADTFDRIRLEDMQKNAAAMAILLYALAEMDGSLRP